MNQCRNKCGAEVLQHRLIVSGGGGSHAKVKQTSFDRMVLFLEAARFGAAISSIKKIVMEKILRKTLKKYDKVKF